MKRIITLLLVFLLATTNINVTSVFADDEANAIKENEQAEVIKEENVVKENEQTEVIKEETGKDDATNENAPLGLPSEDIDNDEDNTNSDEELATQENVDDEETVADKQITEQDSEEKIEDDNSGLMAMSLSNTNEEDVDGPAIESYEFLNNGDTIAYNGTIKFIVYAYDAVGNIVDAYINVIDIEHKNHSYGCNATVTRMSERTDHKKDKYEVVVTLNDDLQDCTIAITYATLVDDSGNSTWFIDDDNSEYKNTVIVSPAPDYGYTNLSYSMDTYEVVLNDANEDEPYSYYDTYLTISGEGAEKLHEDIGSSLYAEFYGDYSGKRGGTIWLDTEWDDSTYDDTTKTFKIKVRWTCEYADGEYHLQQLHYWSNTEQKTVNLFPETNWTVNFKCETSSSNGIEINDIKIYDSTTSSWIKPGASIKKGDNIVIYVYVNNENGNIVTKYDKYTDYPSIYLENPYYNGKSYQSGDSDFMFLAYNKDLSNNEEAVFVSQSSYNESIGYNDANKEISTSDYLCGEWVVEYINLHDKVGNDVENSYDIRLNNYFYVTDDGSPTVIASSPVEVELYNLEKNDDGYSYYSSNSVLLNIASRSTIDQIIEASGLTVDVPAGSKLVGYYINYNFKKVYSGDTEVPIYSGYKQYLDIYPAFDKIESKTCLSYLAEQQYEDENDKLITDYYIEQKEYSMVFTPETKLSDVINTILTSENVNSIKDLSLSNMAKGFTAECFSFYGDEELSKDDLNQSIVLPSSNGSWLTIIYDKCPLKVDFTYADNDGNIQNANLEKTFKWGTDLKTAVIEMIDEFVADSANNVSPLTGDKIYSEYLNYIDEYGYSDIVRLYQMNLNVYSESKFGKTATVYISEKTGEDQWEDEAKLVFVGTKIDLKHDNSYGHLKWYTYDSSANKDVEITNYEFTPNDFGDFYIYSEITSTKGGSGSSSSESSSSSETTTATTPVVKTTVANSINTNNGTTKGTGSNPNVFEGDTTGTKVDAEVQETIVKDISEAKADETITISMKNADGSQATVISKEVLQEIAKAADNVDVVFDMGGYSWTINTGDILTDNLQDIDMTVTFDTTVVPQNVVQSVSNGNYTKQISLSHNGDFGFKAKLNIDLPEANNGQYANLYYYDSTGKLVFRNASEVIDGAASLEFSHASDYVIVVSDEDMTPVEEATVTEEPVTEEAVTSTISTSVKLPIILVCMAALVGIVFAIIKVKNSK